MNYYRLTIRDRRWAVDYWHDTPVTGGIPINFLGYALVIGNEFIEFYYTSKKMKRFFISWEQINGKRPSVDPPKPEQVKAFWHSGSSAETSIMHAIIDTESINKAEEIARSVWDGGNSKIGKIRFIVEHAADWLPSENFPVTTDWAKERLGLSDG